MARVMATSSGIAAASSTAGRPGIGFGPAVSAREPDGKGAPGISPSRTGIGHGRGRRRADRRMAPLPAQARASEAIVAATTMISAYSVV